MPSRYVMPVLVYIVLLVVLSGGAHADWPHHWSPIKAEWVTTWGGLDSATWCGSGAHLDSCRDMGIDTEGNIWVTGRMNVGDDYRPPDEDEWDCGYVRKYDSRGGLLRECYFGGFAGTGSSLAPLGSECFVVCGLSEGGKLTLADGNDVAGLGKYLVKFSSEVEPEWARRIANNRGDRQSRTGYETTLKIGTEGRIYIAGDYSGIIDFEPGQGQQLMFSENYRTPGPFAGDNNAIFVACYETSGAYKWAVSLGGTPAWEGQPLAVDRDGNIYLAGQFTDRVDMDPGPDEYPVQSIYLEDNFLLKLTGEGEFLWARTWGGGGNERVIGIDVDRDGRVIVVGQFTGEVKFDPSPDGRVINPPRDNTFFINTFDRDGNHLWVKIFGGEDRNSSGYQTVDAVATDSESRIYISGTSDFPFDLDPGEGAFNIAPEEHSKASFIQILDGNGNFLSGTWFSTGFMGSTIRSIGFDGGRNMVLSGEFWGTLEVELPGEVKTITSTGFDIENLYNSASDCFLMEIRLPDLPTFAVPGPASY
jgi:hypothetical protein